MDIYVEKKGTYASFGTEWIIGVSDILKLKSASKLWSDNDKNILNDVCELLDQLPVEEHYVNGYKKGYLILSVSSWRKTFSQHISIDEEELKKYIDIAYRLDFLWKDFSKMCKQSGIVCKKTGISNVIKLAEAVSNEEVSYKTLEDLNNFGEGLGYAVFTGNGYLDFQKCSTPLVGARIFASEELAKKFYPKGTVVKIEMTLSEVVSENKYQSLENALSTQQKKRLNQALEQMEVEQLRKRLLELESKYDETSVTKTQQKRKM